MSARYDGIAEWYDAHLADFVRRGTTVLREFLGRGPGWLLELGCGGGIQLAGLAGDGWSLVGLDLSRDQLRVARQRVGKAVELVRGDAVALPFADASFDAICAAFLHTDVDDFAAVVTQAAHALRPGGRFSYVGTHPCFVGPFSRYPGDGPPELHTGYRQTGRVHEGPGIGDGIRRRVGVQHLPLAILLNAFPDAGLHLERVAEPGPEEFPRLLAIQARKL
jgi:SAM-dependent methyltransferase